MYRVYTNVSDTEKTADHWYGNNLVSMDDLWADVYFRMHCALADDVTAELHLL